MNENCKMMISFLKKCGYSEVRRRGSHFTFRSTDGKTITINKDLNKMVMRRLMKEVAE